MSYTSLSRRSPTQQWIQQGNSKGWNAPFPLRSLGSNAHLTPGREAAQYSGQLGLYPSLSSWGHGLCLWTQGALSLSSLPASAWHYARFWWDILGSILPCAAAGCRGVLAPVVVFYYCFVSKAAFHLHPVCALPSILWKLTREKIRYFHHPTSLLSLQVPGLWIQSFLQSLGSCPIFTYICVMLIDWTFVSPLSLWVPLDCSQHGHQCLLRCELTAPLAIPQLCHPQPQAVCLVTRVIQGPHGTLCYWEFIISLNQGLQQLRISRSSLNIWLQWKLLPLWPGNCVSSFVALHVRWSIIRFLRTPLVQRAAFLINEPCIK